MPPEVSRKFRATCLCNLPRLQRSLVAKLEDAGFWTVADCIDRWHVLQTAARGLEERAEGAPVMFGRLFLRQLRAAICYYNRVGAPPVDNREDEPTPEEIRRRCAEVRDGWDARRWREEERVERARVPVVTVSMEDRRDLYGR